MSESPLHIFGAQLVLLWRTIKAARREGIVWKEVLRHMAELGTSSASLIFMGLFFFAYRDFVGDADALLEHQGFGRAHHRVL